AVTMLAALLLDAPAGPRKPLATWVALSASASWRRASDSTPWKEAWRDVRSAQPESLFLFGDSLRAIRTTDSLTTPVDLSSIARPAVERALGRGHPLIVVTDGELADPEALLELPSGSRVVVVNHAQAPDLAVAALAVPTRGYFRVAANVWRVDGSLAPISEADVRTAFREAPVAILHGDTAAFGPPRAATSGPLALVVPATSSDGEWYAAAAPPS